MTKNNFPEIGGLIVSKYITEKGEKPKFMYRDKRSSDEDSGWRVFSGKESDEYINNPENVGIYHASHIIEIDPSIENLLLRGIGSVFEKENNTSNWYEVNDFKLDDDYIIENKIVDDWVIQINNLFEQRLEESGDILYTTGDKSVRIAVWNFSKNKEEIYQDQKQLINQTQANILKKYEYSDSQILRIGYQVEEKDHRKNYRVIYGSSIIDRQLIQIALYFDKDLDEDWAINAWKNIKIKKRSTT